MLDFASPPALRHVASAIGGGGSGKLPQVVEVWNRGNDSPRPTSGTIDGAPKHSDAFSGGARPGRAFCFWEGSVRGTPKGDARIARHTRGNKKGRDPEAACRHPCRLSNRRMIGL